MFKIQAVSETFLKIMLLKRKYIIIFKWNPIFRASAKLLLVLSNNKLLCIVSVFVFANIFLHHHKLNEIHTYL